MPRARSIANIKNSVLAGAALMAALGPCIAAAALGEPETSVQTDVAQLRGSIKVTAHADYELHEIQMPSGTLVREFVGPTARSLRSHGMARPCRICARPWGSTSTPT